MRALALRRSTLHMAHVVQRLQEGLAVRTEQFLSARLIHSCCGGCCVRRCPRPSTAHLCICTRLKVTSVTTSAPLARRVRGCMLTSLSTRVQCHAIHQAVHNLVTAKMGYGKACSQIRNQRLQREQLHALQHFGFPAMQEPDCVQRAVIHMAMRVAAAGDTVFALVVTAPHAAFEKDGEDLRHIQETFKLL